MFSYYDSLESELGNGFRPFRYKLEIVFPPSSESKLGVSFNMFSGNIANTLVKATTLPGVRIQPRNFYTKGGHIVPISGAKVYDTEWNATFYLDDNFKLRNIFERWVALQDSFMTGSIKNWATNKSITDSVKESLSSFISGGLDVIQDVQVSPSSKELNALGDLPFTVQAGVIASNILGGTTAKKTDDLAGLYGTIKITPLDIDDSREIYTYVLHNAFPMNLQAIQLDDSMTTNIGEFTCSFGFSHYTVTTKPSLLQSLSGGAVSGLTNIGTSIRGGISAVTGSASSFLSKMGG